MFDVHAHMTDALFAPDFDAVLARAAAAGVTDIIAVSEGLDDADKVIRLAAQGDSSHGVRIHPALGMHPCGANLEDIGQMLELMDRHRDRLVCIGEVGLDYSPRVLGDDPAAAERVKDVQRAVLKLQAEKARALGGLPLNVHSRSAGHHTVSLLQELGVEAAVLHAFDGRAVHAERGAQVGYYFSVPPSASRPGSSFREIVKRLPLKSLLLETDSPALFHVDDERMRNVAHPGCVGGGGERQAAEKGVRNEPANLALSCRFIAEVKGVTEEAVREATTQNARRLFPRAFAALATRGRTGT